MLEECHVMSVWIGGIISTATISVTSSFSPTAGHLQYTNNLLWNTLLKQNKFVKFSTAW